MAFEAVFEVSLEFIDGLPQLTRELDEVLGCIELLARPPVQQVLKFLKRVMASVLIL